MNHNFSRFVDPAVTPETDEERTARMLAERKEATRRNREAVFAAVCPAEYAAFNPARCANPRAHAEVVRLVKSGKSCRIVGMTGSGKTFAVWAGLRCLIMRGLNPVVYSGVAFASRSSEAYSADDRAGDWLDSVAGAPVLFIDDWGKEAFTETQERALFEIIERRSAWVGKQTILATNRTASDILRQQREAKKETGRTEDILRRLSQRFEHVQFRD